MRKNKLITRRIINWGFVAAACLLVLIYLWDWYNLPWILHAEINNDISSFLAGDSVGIKDFIAKIFDMRVIERTNQGGGHTAREFWLLLCSIRTLSFGSYSIELQILVPDGLFLF